MDNGKERGYILKKFHKTEVLFVISYIIAASIFIYTFLALQIKIWISYGQNYCMLDCLHALEKPYYFGMVFLPMALFGILSGRKVYYYPAFVLKYESTSEIWNIFWRAVVKRSILLSGIFSIIACFLSGMSSYTVNNWNEQGTLFYQITKTVFSGSAVYVIGIFFLFNIIKLCLASAILVFAEWVLGGSMWGIVILTTFGIIEWVFDDIPIFFNLFSISQIYFKAPECIVGILLSGCLLLIAVYLIGKKIWKEKEFYGR